MRRNQQLDEQDTRTRTRILDHPSRKKDARVVFSVEIIMGAFSNSRRSTSIILLPVASSRETTASLTISLSMTISLSIKQDRRHFGLLIVQN